MNDRIRKVDVEKMSLDRADQLSKQIGDKVVGVQQEALEKINKILNIYGMEAQISVSISKTQEK
jgi:hypothetical protein